MLSCPQICKSKSNRTRNKRSHSNSVEYISICERKNETAHFSLKRNVCRWLLPSIKIKSVWVFSISSLKFHHINSILQGTICKISLYQYCSSSCYIFFKVLIYQPDNFCSLMKHQKLSYSCFQCVCVAECNWLFQNTFAIHMSKTQWKKNVCFSPEGQPRY